jgi:hypothetical protein
MITVYPIGTTIYNPEKAFGGYTLLNFLHEPDITLFDMNGNVVNAWAVERGRDEPAPGVPPAPPPAGPRDDPPGAGAPRSGIWNYAHLLENGNLLGPREYDWDNEIVWEPPVVPGYTAGLSRRLDNGNTVYSSRREVPEEYKAKVKDPARRHLGSGDRWPPGLQGHSIFETTPAGDVVWEWHAWEHLDLNHYLEIDPSPNWTHFNHLDPLPENRWFDAGDERFRPGNILVSPRTLGFIFIIDKQTGKVVWEHSGTHRGGIAGQHDPRMIPKGLPGAGNILLLDNGQPPVQDISRAGRTSILEIDPVAGGVVWSYEDDGYLTSEDPGYSHNYNEFKFFTAYTGSVQRLPNGNTFIGEALGGRIFEVTAEKELVWEYAIERHRSYETAYRYPYDHCPQLARLGTPVETPVVPPPHVRTFYKGGVPVEHLTLGERQGDTEGRT